MSDLYHPAVSDEFILQVLDIVGRCPQHVFQILTKRPVRLVDFRYPENVWLGVSVEDQAAADLRIPQLLEVRAPVRWVSCEPLLGPVNLDPWAGQLDWVVVGGESGPRHRPMDPSWANDILLSCASGGTAFFMKQMAGKPLTLTETDPPLLTKTDPLTSRGILFC